MFQDLIQQPLVTTESVTIELVVSAHDGARLRTLDGDLESEQFRFTQPGWIDDRILPVAVVLEVVRGIVLQRGNDSAALNPVDGLGGHHSCEPWVFRVVFVVPSVPHFAREVGSATENDVEAAHTRLASDGFANPPRQ